MTPDFWDKLWNAGIPLLLLVAGIVKLWITWRSDTAIANRQRDEFTAAIYAQNEKISELSDNIREVILKSKL